MGKKDVENQEELYSSMVNHNSMLLKFEGWIKYIEGFSRGLQTTKTVDAASVLDCVGEIMEYMKTLKQDILDLLQHCENILEEHDELLEQNKLLIEQKDVPQIEIIEEEVDGKV